ncbi:thermonuclease family protein [Microvirga antarctica]|uniref:thermonuclease family protein n=1 Tax=Microvirga antarctica TaxID=2819233 RepID=UPI001B3155D8|nr:hypothetical protein [Microvirga antarctica]
MRRWRAFIVVGLLGAVWATTLSAAERVARPAPASCSSPGDWDVIAGVSAEGDLLMLAGGPARLGAVRLPDDGPFRDEALAYLRGHSGARVRVQGPAGRDRWSRRTVRLLRDDQAEEADLGRSLIARGLGLADPQSADPACPDDFLAQEEAARQRSLGVWADAGYKPIGSEQLDRLTARIGTFALVEGRVRSVGERPQRTYLNFGGQWADDFTVIIPKRTWKRMTERGIDAAALKGRQVRVRGILEAWQGASLTVEIPDMIERLPR